MLSKRHIESLVIDHFKDVERFSSDELFSFYKQFEPDLKEGTFGWRVYELKKKHVIKNVLKGVYTIDQTQNFRPEPDNTLKQLSNILSHSLNYHFYNIWTTAWLNELIVLQATSFLYILEVDKESMPNVFYFIKEQTRFKNVFLNPDNKVIENYISEVEAAIIVKPMVTKAPVMKVKNVIMPTLEKILVDLYCDDRLYYAYQGQQLVNIYQSCINKYSINYSRLFSYARRRKREEAIKNFLSDHPILAEKIKDVIE